MGKKDKKNPFFQSGYLNTRLYRVVSIFVFKEKIFLAIVVTSFMLAGIFFPYPQVAMWLGFTFAAYSAIANDSIQTIGTFLVSNAHRKWYFLWLFIGIIFVLTAFYSWYTLDGDVSYQRLTSKGFETAPDKFAFLQVAAPIFLLIITRMRMPVSTTFLLLSAFSTSSAGITGMLSKSILGYFIAFSTSFIVWSLFDKKINNLTKKPAANYWTIIQWVTSGVLWAVWIMQDAANIAVFLPRQLDLTEFIAFISIIFFGLGILFFLRGDKIQNIVNEKTEITDVRTATFIDLTYAIILFVFKNLSNVPMSTTWVFIGLLGGREIAMNIISRKVKAKQRKFVFKMVFRDIAYALFGLVISIILAVAINPQILQELVDFFTKLNLIQNHLMQKLLIITLITILLPFIISYFVGRKRNIGFAWSFFFSLFLSPIIGFIITLASSRNNETVLLKNNTVKIWAYILIVLFTISLLGQLILIFTNYDINPIQVTTFIFSIGLLGLGYYLLELTKGKVFNKIK